MTALTKLLNASGSHTTTDAELTAATDDVLSTCRDSRACTDFLSQSLPTYYAKVAVDNAHDRVHHLLGNFLLNRVMTANERVTYYKAWRRAWDGMASNGSASSTRWRMWLGAVLLGIAAPSLFIARFERPAMPTILGIVWASPSCSQRCCSPRTARGEDAFDQASTRWPSASPRRSCRCQR